MNRTDVTLLPEAADRMRGDRRVSLPDFSRPLLDIDLSRPPEPGSFRFSLETMRRSAVEISRRPSPRAGGHPPAQKRPHTRVVSRRSDERTTVRKGPEQRPQSAAQKGKHRRPAETRQHEAGPGTDREQTSVRSHQAPGPEDKHPAAVEPEPQSDAVAGAASGNLQAAAATAPAQEGAASADGGDGNQASPDATDSGTSSGKSTAARVVSQGAGGGEKAASPAPAAEPGDAQPAAADEAAGTKKSRVALPGKAAGEKQARTAAKPSVMPPAAQSAEGGGPAGTQGKAAAVAAAKATTTGDAGVQAPLPAGPVTVSREAAVSSASAEGKMAATLEGSSPGRVARVGTDTQSGQTGLFQGHHGPAGSIQAGSGAGAADAPVQPFAHDLLQQVTEKTVFHLRDGRVEARIDLKPESLGHLRLHVSTDNGRVTLKILTESVWVRDIIESNINHLKSELQHHNLQIDRLDVSVSGGGQDSAGGNSQTADSSRPPTDSFGTGERGPAVLADEEDAPRPPVPRMGVGLVDYFA